MAIQETREAKLHFELHRHLQNAIERGLTVRDVTFRRSEPEYSKGLPGGKSADIVLFDTRDRPWLVVEAKRWTGDGGFTRDFDPYSPKVVQQAYGYASVLGAPFFATYNGELLVLFRTYEEFKPLLQRKTKSYRVKDIAVFAEELLRDIVALHHDELRWDNLDDAFVTRAKHFHERMVSHILPALRRALTADKAFRNLFARWTKEQGFDLENRRQEVEETFAKQAAYVLMNQLLFYKVLESEPAYHGRVPPLAPTEPAKQLADALRSRFAQVVTKVDFKAVFESDPVYARIPLPPPIPDLVAEFIEELAEYDLTVFSSDVIGRIYEHLIPAKERHDLGQYYTPPAIVDLIVRLVVTRPEDTVLDPACGSGSFLVKAYHRLRALYQEQGKQVSHRQLLRQIYGIDINRFPAHLTAINLAVQDIASRTDNVQVEVADFFDITPGQGRFARKLATVTGEPVEEPVAIPSRVAAVVANPPYIRQEKIADKRRVRAHLERLDVAMTERADIYAYFFTHAMEFLSKNSRIGFITSDRWLDVEYGEELQQFFLDHFKIRALIKFDRQVFEDPLIGSVVTVLERCQEAVARDQNVVVMLRLKRSVESDKVVQLLDGRGTAETMEETAAYRVVAMSQARLRRERKWRRFLYAPPIYFDLLNRKEVVPLERVATLTRGITSGANEFFYLKKTDLRALGIPETLVAPLMKHIAQAKHPDFAAADTEWCVLNLHSLLVTKVLPSIGAATEGSVLKRHVMDRLSELGYESMVEYIRVGEQKAYHKRPTCRGRKLWFDLGELLRPPLIFPEVYWKKIFVPYNKDRIVVDKRLYTLEPKDGVDELVLGGILNSDWFPLFRELHGRIEMGEALNRNTMMVYEAKALPVVDPRLIDRKDADRIKEVFQQLLAECRGASEVRVEELRHELNGGVLAALGMENRVDELEAAVRELLDIRIAGGGAAKEVMVEEREERRIIRLRGAEVVARRSLDEYV